MLTEIEKQKLKDYCIYKLKDNFDLFDFESEIDNSLNYFENINILKDKMSLFMETSLKAQIEDYKQTENKYSNQLQSKDYALKRIFEDSHIIGLVGVKNSGKTNNLIAMIKEFRDNRNTTPIYVYGFKPQIIDYLKQYDCIEISEIKHLIGKKDCILICDEYQRLKLNDRRYTEERDEFKNYVYHNNVYVILSSPDVREFNSIIGGIIEKWIVKSLSLNDCVNGSQLKKAIDEYKGNYKHLGSIELPKDKLLILNSLFEQKITCEYIQEADTKRFNKSLF